MKASKQNLTRPAVAAVIETPMTGPGVIRVCAKCKGPIEEGQHWRRVTAPDGAYSVGVHDGCLAGQGVTA